MSLLFQKRLKFPKINDPQLLNILKQNISLPQIHQIKHNIGGEKNYKLKSLSELIHKDTNLVRMLNLNDTKTKIPFQQIHNSEINHLPNIEIMEKRKEILSQWEKDEGDINNIYSNVDQKELRQKKYLKKLQVFEKEKMLFDKIKESEKNIKSLKEEINTMCVKIIKLNEKIEYYNYDLETIKTDNKKIVAKSQVRLSPKKKEKQNLQMKKLLTPENLSINKTSLFNFESQMKKYDSLQEKKNMIMNKINHYKEKLSAIKEEQNNKKILLTEKQKENKDFKKELLNYYHKILLEGIDTRRDGLSWVIQSIWDLDEEVDLNYMPNFLDVNAINYLFTITKKNNVLNNLRNYIERFKLDSLKTIPVDNSNIETTISNSKMNNNYNTMEINNSSEENKNKNFIVFNTCLKKFNQLNTKLYEKINEKRVTPIGIRDYLKMKKKEEKKRIILKKKRAASLQNINPDNNEKLTFKMFLDNSNNDITFSDCNENSAILSLRKEKDKFIEKFNQLKTLQKCIEKEIEITKKQEIERIFDEFVSNDYSKKFETNIKIVLSALIGENNMLKEIKKQRYNNNKLKKLKKLCAFYDAYEKIKKLHNYEKKYV